MTATKNGTTLIEVISIIAIITILLVMLFGLQNRTPKTKVIDGCEYLVSYDGDLGVNYAHKGNCTNSIHKQRGE